MFMSLYTPKKLKNAHMEQITVTGGCGGGWGPSSRIRSGGEISHNAALKNDVHVCLCKQLNEADKEKPLNYAGCLWKTSNKSSFIC